MGKEINKDTLSRSAVTVPIPQVCRIQPVCGVQLPQGALLCFSTCYPSAFGNTLKIIA